MDLLFALLKLALILAPFGYWVYRRERGRKWPTVTGQVERCERAAFPGQYGPIHGIRLFYSFEANGDRYQGHLAEKGFSLASQIDDFIARFKGGETVIVRFNPKDPKVSELQYRDNPTLDIGLISGAPMTRVDE